MHPLEDRLRRSKRNPIAFLGGSLAAAIVFVAMGLTQLDVEYTPPPEPAPISEFHLPPPPPPPKVEQPKQTPNIAIDFDLPVTSDATSIPLAFLEVDFGLNPKKLVKTDLSVDDTIANYETDGLEDLSVYEMEDVTEPPKKIFQPPISIHSRKLGGSKKPFSFLAIYKIDTKGRVSNVHIIDCPHPAAIPELKEWLEDTRYRPAKKDGKRVNLMISVRITYRTTSRTPFSL